MNAARTQAPKRATKPIVYPMPARNGHKKRDQTTQELLLQLKELRVNVDEVAEQFRLRVSGQLAEIARAVEGRDLLPKQKRLSAKAAAQMLAEVQQLSLKPRKGRAKDLVRLQELAKKLSALLPAED